MARYIDADNARIDADERGFEYWYSDVDIDAVQRFLDDQPTADVRENVHGKWLMSDVSKLRPYMCSRCGSLYDVDTVMGKIVWNYCPNCGAKMERSEDGKTG